MNSMSALVKRNTDLDLYLIDLPLHLSGFQKFLNSWLIMDRSIGRSFLVDTGPAATIPFLEKSLASLGVERIDFLLLTHVHLDHAGGAGEFCQNFPTGQVIVSPKGSRHIVDPSRLWVGSLATLGDMAEAYGKPVPLTSSSIVKSDSGGFPFEILETPGHASHHLSFIYKNLLFAGEAAGVHLPVEPASEMMKIWNDKCSLSDIEDLPPYLRPATPPPFKMETSLRSIDMLMETNTSTICYCHYGFSDDPSGMLYSHRAQLLFWEREIKFLLKESWRSGIVSTEKDMVNKCLSHLLQVDPCLRRIEFLSGHVRKREEFFLKNSIRGFIRYLKPAMEK